MVQFIVIIKMQIPPPQKMLVKDNEQSDRIWISFSNGTKEAVLSNNFWELMKLSSRAAEICATTKIFEAATSTYVPYM